VFTYYAGHEVTRAEAFKLWRAERKCWMFRHGTQPIVWRILRKRAMRFASY
jgi:hypothetical protein